MKTNKEWASGLHIAPEKYRLWLRDAPAGESFTVWCLLSGKLNEDEYLAWARDFYGLPSLHSQYFSQAPNQKLWQKIHSVANWSAEMLPIAEWDGVIYVACVEPHMELKWSFPVQYVLAQAQDLKHLWQQLVTFDEKSFAGIPPTPDKQNIAHVDENDGQNLDEPIFEFTADQVKKPSPEALKIVVPKIAVPNIVVPAAPVETQGAPPVPAASNAAPLPDEPAGLNLNVLNKKPVNKDRDFMAELASSMGTSDTKTATDKTDSVAVNLDLTAPEGFANNTMPAVPSFVMPTPVAPTVAPTAAPKPMAPPRPAPVAATPVAPPPPTDFAVPAAAVTAQVTPLTTPAVPTPALEQQREVPRGDIAAAPHVPQHIVKFLARMQANFTGGMIIEISKDNFTPIVWDENFKPKPGVRTVWNLNPPSAFRIAYRTGQPYVGHVVETPTNAEFFSSWGFDGLPKSILVQPVKNIDEQVTHLLLCLSDGIKKNHQVLSEGERLGTDFAELNNKSEAA